MTIVLRENEPNIYVEPFIRKLIETRVQEIIYGFAVKRLLYLEEEEMIVAVDILGFLCMVYDQPPLIDVNLTQTWRSNTLKLWQDSMGEGWGEFDPLYQNIIEAFDRLEAIAKKYPPQEW
ncbi:MAG: hypothetical protein ABI690_32970 [Chloroflexota bacterium]